MPGVSSDSNRTTKVITDNRCIRERLRKIRQLRDLRVIDPALECQPIRAQVRVAATEIGIEQEMLDHGRPRQVARCNACSRKRTRLGPRATMTDAAEPLAAGRELRFEDGRNSVAQSKIHRANDSCGGAQITIPAARA